MRALLAPQQRIESIPRGCKNQPDFTEVAIRSTDAVLLTGYTDRMCHGSTALAKTKLDYLVTEIKN